jgi:hypothetical protein
MGDLIVIGLHGRTRPPGIVRGVPTAKATGPQPNGAFGGSPEGFSPSGAHLSADCFHAGSGNTRYAVPEFGPVQTQREIYVRLFFGNARWISLEQKQIQQIGPFFKNLDISRFHGKTREPSQTYIDVRSNPVRGQHD